jgi:hypothetical protein
MYWEVKKIKKEDFEMNIFEKTELLKFVSQLENNVDALETIIMFRMPCRKSRIPYQPLRLI